MRGYYIAVPVFCFLFGPTWLLGSSLLFILLLQRADTVNLSALIRLKLKYLKQKRREV